MESLRKILMASGASHVVPVDPRAIRVYAWPRFKCQYGCPRYGKNYTCPPFVPALSSVRELLSEYSQALLFCFEGYSTTADFAGMQEAARSVEREAFRMGHYKAFCFVGGSCKLCDSCAAESGESCYRPQDKRPSLESCGIDVYEVARNAGIALDIVPTRDSRFNALGMLLIE
jgi:predicted metal-binding protein